MDAAFFREFADRIRRLMLTSRTDYARRQLAIWAEEFEQQADALDREAINLTRTRHRVDD
ncbi:MAG: hypothetical protein ACM3JG_20985 [Thiohalocapsa sp.]